ncbi:MAG: hypothetical protein RLY31_2588 [Bacteroidota bacterium]
MQTMGRLYNKQREHWYSSIGWMAAGIFSLLSLRFLPAEWVETYYSRWLYLGIRTMLSGLAGQLPFAACYLLLCLLPAVGLWRLGRRWQAGTFASVRVGRLILSSLAWLGGAIMVFQVLWGLNYRRIPLEETIGIVPGPMDAGVLERALEAGTAELSLLRSHIRLQDDAPIAAWPYSSDRMADTVRAALRTVLESFGYPAPSTVRARLLHPEGLLLRIGAAGFYLPYTGEGHVDAGLHPLQLPFVMAHEMAHGYGFGDEGNCNFLAWLACLHNRDPFVQYAGHLYYWRYLVAAYRAACPEEADNLLRRLPAGIRADLASVQARMDLYPDFFPGLRDAAYERYLQAQGIREGMLSYDKLVWMALAWRERQPQE